MARREPAGRTKVRPGRHGVRARAGRAERTQPGIGARSLRSRGGGPPRRRVAPPSTRRRRQNVGPRTPRSPARSPRSLRAPQALHRDGARAYGGRRRNGRTVPNRVSGITRHAISRPPSRRGRGRGAAVRPDGVAPPVGGVVGDVDVHHRCRSTSVMTGCKPQPIDRFPVLCRPHPVAGRLSRDVSAIPGGHLRHCLFPQFSRDGTVPPLQVGRQLLSWIPGVFEALGVAPAEEERPPRQRHGHGTHPASCPRIGCDEVTTGRCPFGG